MSMVMNLIVNWTADCLDEENGQFMPIAYIR